MSNQDELERVAEAVRHACLVTALEAYEEGGLAGMCLEGRWDLAVDALKALDVAQIAAQLAAQVGSKTLPHSHPETPTRG